MMKTEEAKKNKQAIEKKAATKLEQATSELINDIIPFLPL
jgi:hypothetical protein